ncbi:MAG TPA: copper resistance protein CopC [bacterium]|nr:copper resistance protein CopC [bacterium]
MIRVARFVLIAVTVLACGQAAAAHALLSLSDPASGATLDRPPRTITLTFTEEPEPSLSSIRLLLPTGQPVPQGPVQAVPGRPRTLMVAVGPLATGVYTVAWRTVSKVDGHVTGGAFAFGVGTSPANTALPQVTSPPPSVLGGGARWALYAGLSVLLGASWVWTIALPSVPARPGRWLWIPCLLALLGVAALGESQRQDAAAPLAQFLSTSLGRALAWRILPLLGVAAALAASGETEPRRRLSLWAVGVFAAGTALAHVTAGHAAAALGPWRWANVAAQWVHMVSVGAWLGGLAVLIPTLGRTPSDAKAGTVRRFSTAAGILLVLVAATGTIRAVNEVGGWGQLTTTAYGRLVTLKAALLLLLAAMGGVNRFWSVPRAIRSLAGLRRIGTAELAVGAVTLAVAATLTQTAPANFPTPQAEGPAPLVAAGSDFATTTRVRLEVAPGYPGTNRFVASIRDYDSGRPVEADRVSLRFTSRDRPDIGASTLVLARSADGSYRGQGSNLSLEGPWVVTALVEQGANSVEVPLALGVPAPPERIRTIEAPGQPALYSIDLPGGRVLDAYLDPGRAGLNEVHATYIDAAGHEMPIPHLATMAANRPGATPAPLPVRRFGPGHFIGDAQLSRGEWELTITVTTSAGEVLRSHLPVRL